MCERSTTMTQTESDCVNGCSPVKDFDLTCINDDMRAIVQPAVVNMKHL